MTEIKYMQSRIINDFCGMKEQLNSATNPITSIEMTSNADV